jgi:hypothetical protein
MNRGQVRLADKWKDQRQQIQASSKGDHDLDALKTLVDLITVSQIVNLAVISVKCSMVKRGW